MKNKNSGTVVSSRIRLARNFKEMPFISAMTIEQKNNLKNELRNYVKEDNIYKLNYIDMEKVSNIQAGAMVEEHLISIEFANKKEGSALLLNNEKMLSVMLNEEDHLRIQAISSELNLSELYKVADEADNYFDSKKPFAYSETLGYLTGCPTNLGTGMRASLMMHLPALTDSGYISRIVNYVSGIGLTVRGLYGEGTQPGGGMYQMSNRVCLGISEADAIERLEESAKKIEENEKEVREKMLKDISVQDRIFRNYGILKEARVLSSAEFIRMMSDVRLGVCGGLIDLDFKDLDDLFIKVQPYNIMLSGGDALEVQQRDIHRAKMTRETLKINN